MISNPRLVSWSGMISRQEDVPPGGFGRSCWIFNFRPAFVAMRQEDRNIYERNDTRAMGRFFGYYNSYFPLVMFKY